MHGQISREPIAPRLAIAALIVCVAAVACRSEPPPASKPGFVTHVVVCWLKSPGDDEGRRRLVEVSKTLEGIPGVVSVAAGRVLPSDRPIVVSDFDVAIVLTFESEQAMRAYLEHPDHKRAVQETLKPLVERYVVYDFVVE